MFQNSSSSPLSFADLLCTAASDIIDWAPPGKVTSWSQQMQTAAKRSADDAREERLQYSARSGGSSSQLDSAAALSPPPGGSASPEASRGNTSPRGGGGAGVRWGNMWYRGLIDGMFGVQSQMGGRLVDFDSFAWVAGLTTSLTLSGLPVCLDAAWRTSSELTWKHTWRHLYMHSQWMTPLRTGGWPTSTDVHFKSPMCDIACRIDSQLYLVSGCLNVFPRRPRSNAPVVGSSSSGNRRWVEQIRGGVGLALKRDLASGINLFTGVAVQTSQGLNASYHIDVLRRLTCSLSSSIAGGGGGGNINSSSSSSSRSGVVGDTLLGLRLKMNTITFQGTVLDWGVSVPLTTLLKDRSSEPAPASSSSWRSRIPTGLRVQCSHSSAGSMIGLQWKDAQDVLSAEYRRWLGGDVKVDIIAGVVTKRLPLNPWSSSSGCGSTKSISGSLTTSSPVVITPHDPAAAAASAGGGGGERSSSEPPSQASPNVSTVAPFSFSKLRMASFFVISIE